MNVCVNHPDKTAGLVCMKYQIHVCGKYANCRDPQLYRKHRTACPVWFIAKHGENEWAKLQGTKSSGPRRQRGRVVFQA